MKLMNKDMDNLAAAPKVLNENDKVRILKVVFKPGEVAKMHHHPDHVVYAIEGGKLSITSGGKTQESEINTGSATFFEAQDHEVKNIGNTTIDLIVTELKK